ncbi:probable inactive receptor kinase At5g58300 [Aristolochia californica]|uniref:probable inactive receptor kinase At5g58300 n=1 Tax=Aristolochia californica TaxID=171875 RepID=UPI0035DA832F
MQVSRHRGDKSPAKPGGGEEGSGTSRSVSQYLTVDEDYVLPTGGEYAITINFCEASGPFARPVALREVLTSSVQLLGESSVGISEKVVLVDGLVFCAKRFRRVLVRKSRYGKSLERLAHVTTGCKYLVPLHGYIYTKRIKIVLCEYYAMGSLADLLAGARELGHTPLNWEKRIRIMVDVTRAISFIHNQTPPCQRYLAMNVHGNVKASNVFIKTDFSACLSDYGFVQLAERTDQASYSPSRRLPEVTNFDGRLAAESDVYNFGVMVLDMLGGPTAPFQTDSISKRLEEIKTGSLKFFEFVPEGWERKQAIDVLETALASTRRLPDTRPSIDRILGKLEKLLSSAESLLAHT